MQEEEPDVGASDEAGDVIIEELVDHFEVPISRGKGKGDV